MQCILFKVIEMKRTEKKGPNYCPLSCVKYGKDKSFNTAQVSNPVDPTDLVHFVGMSRSLFALSFFFFCSCTISHMYSMHSEYLF